MPLPTSILRMLESLNTGTCPMPPTMLYNEGWMLRLILDAGAHGALPEVIPPGSRWYSEAQLRSPFGKDKGKKHEGNTHADGVVGDFSYIDDTTSGLSINTDADTLCVFEAKMYSPLSSGTKNAPGYDQAARNVACIAYALQNAKRHPDSMERIGFYVVAPQSQITSGLFDRAMTFTSIRSRVTERIQQFSGTSRDALLDWHETWFAPPITKMESDQSLTLISWEHLIEQLEKTVPDNAAEIRAFYERCKECNRAVRTQARTYGPVRGKEYTVRAASRDGQRVRVCATGPVNSRVFIEGSSEDAFLVPNSNLEVVPESDQSAASNDPVVGRQYLWQKSTGTKRVQVLNVGNCNSRVLLLDGTTESAKVPNHQLHEVPSED